MYVCYSGASIIQHFRIYAMNSTTSWVAGIIIVLVVIAGAWYFMGQTAPAPATQNTSATSSPTGSTGTSGTGSGTGVSVGGSVSVGSPVTVHLTSSGFSPSSVTIKKGQTVQWVNDTSAPMWVATAQHPTHTVYSGTSLQQHCPGGGNDAFDQCQNGNTYSFTFDKAGTWNYHNHSNATQFGKVVVTE